MSDKNQIVVVLIVALFLGAFVDRATALKIVSGVVLLWSLQNQPVIIECVRKLFSHLSEEDLPFESTAETCPTIAGLRRFVLNLANMGRRERYLLTKQ